MFHPLKCNEDYILTTMRLTMEVLPTYWSPSIMTLLMVSIFVDVRLLDVPVVYPSPGVLIDIEGRE